MQKINIRNWSMEKKLFWGVAAILITALLITSCGSNKATMDSPAIAPGEAQAVYTNQSAAKEAEAPQASASASKDGIGTSNDVQFSEDVSKENIASQRKMIMNGRVYIETLTFDDSINALDKLIQTVGGFAEVRTVRGNSSHSRALRSADYVIRVPAESYDAVLKDMGAVGTVIESTSEGTDITDKYTDSETRVKTLKVQEQTLLDILSKAAKLEDVITLESRISEVRYEIESIENTLKNYDRLVALSRITINIQEVDEETETRPVAKTLDQRISSSFTESLDDFRMGIEDFLVWLVSSWITLLFLLAVIVIFIISIKRSRRKKHLAKQVQASEIKTENKE